jgi:hypothetical protein
MVSGGCLADEVTNISVYMQQAAHDITMDQTIDVIKRVYKHFNTPLDSVFETPTNLPEVTTADVYTYCLLDNDDFEQLFKSE